jgi:hypothetical protein
MLMWSHRPTNLTGDADMPLSEAMHGSAGGARLVSDVLVG